MHMNELIFEKIAEEAYSDEMNKLSGLNPVTGLKNLGKAIASLPSKFKDIKRANRNVLLKSKGADKILDEAYLAANKELKTVISNGLITGGIGAGSIYGGSKLYKATKKSRQE